MIELKIKVDTWEKFITTKKFQPEFLWTSKFIIIILFMSYLRYNIYTGLTVL